MPPHALSRPRHGVPSNGRAEEIAIVAKHAHAHAHAHARARAKPHVTEQAPLRVVARDYGLVWAHYCMPSHCVYECRCASGCGAPARGPCHEPRLSLSELPKVGEMCLTPMPMPPNASCIMVSPLLDESNMARGGAAGGRGLSGRGAAFAGNWCQLV